MMWVRLRQGASAIGLTLLVALFALLVLRLIGAVGLYNIESGSMRPHLNVGDVVVTRTIPAAEVIPGDVVTVRADGQTVTHRVVSSELDRELSPAYRVMTLKGDHNKTQDQFPYIVSSVDRQVFSIPWVGYATSWTAQGFNRFAVVGVVIGAVLLAAWRRERTSSRSVATSSAPAAPTPPRVVVLDREGVSW